MWLLGIRGKLIGFGLAALAFFAALASKKREGKKEARHEFEQDKSRRIDAGREKVRSGRDSGLSPTERVRRNDGDWGGV